MRTTRSIVLLATLALIAACSDNTPEKITPPPQAPQLMPAPLDWVLGFPVAAVGVATVRPIVVQNEGTDALVITNVTLDSYQGPDSAAVFAMDATPETTLAYGHALSLPITFTPVTAGVHRAKVTITSNAANMPAAVFEVVGPATSHPAAVAPQIAFFPGDGAAIAADTGAVAPVRFMNLGTTELTIYGYQILGNDAASFAMPDSVTLPSAECQAAVCGEPMPASCVPVRVGFGFRIGLGLAYQPQSAGAHTATLRIVSNAANCPADISLSGD